MTLERMVKATPTDSSFATLHRSAGSVLRAGIDARSWREAIRLLGERMKEFRSDARSESDARRATFGLPLSLGKDRTKREVTLTNSDRRGSPLHIRVVRIGPKHYDAVLTHLGGRFAPPGENLSIDGKTTSLATASLIPSFLDEEFSGATPLIG